MNAGFSRLSVVSSFVLLAGCSFLQGVPSPDYVNVPNGGDGRSRLSVSDLVNHIECEIASDSSLSTLADRKYTAQITLTLKVDENVGVSPSLNFITPFKVPGTSITKLFNANINTDRQRTYTESFAIDLATLYDDVYPKGSDKAASENTVETLKKTEKCLAHGIFSLSGSLGLDKIIEAGLATTDYADAYIAPPAAGGGAAAHGADKVQTLSEQAETQRTVQSLINSANVKLSLAKISAGGVSVRPSFGSTVQFTITGTADAGPTLVLKHFKGPSASKGILNGGRVDTDTLIVAFAPAKSTLRASIESMISTLKGKNNPREHDLIAALEEADALLTEYETSQASVTTQTLTNNMILQNLGTLQ